MLADLEKELPSAIELPAGMQEKETQTEKGNTNKTHASFIFHRLFAYIFCILGVSFLAYSQVSLTLARLVGLGFLDTAITVFFF